MADQQKDNGPYAVYGRRTEHEAEVRVGVDDSLDRARDIAEDMVGSGGWYQAGVRDRNDQTVHVGRKEDGPSNPVDGADRQDAS